MQAPKPILARRIVEATGGGVTLDMLYRGENAASAKIIGLSAHNDDTELDRDRLKLAFTVVINHLQPADAAPPSPELLEIAAEAVLNTYIALSRLTTRRGSARLEQALRPVLEELLKETGECPSEGTLDKGAELAAAMYHQSRTLQGLP